MTAISIGVVDYGMGNHASVAHCLRSLGMRVRVSDQREILAEADALLLPGVGAFPAAMQELHRRGLVSYLQDQARSRRPIIGICLGMELLASASWEIEHTVGLDLIPGEFVPFAEGGWHIGWNTLEIAAPDPLLQVSDGKAFYFNHSVHFVGPEQSQSAVTRHQAAFASIIRREKVIGMQFHPEKSQQAGRQLLSNVIEGLVRA